MPAATVQQFETDFWKDAKSREVWDEIVPGEQRKTLLYTLAQEAIVLFCRAIGETKALYLDEAAAKAGPCGAWSRPRRSTSS
jgi:3-hydroxybutyryl-CoA dehydratase